MFASFIVCVILTLLFLFLGAFLIGKGDGKEQAGVMMLIFMIIFIGGSIAFFKEYTDEKAKVIDYDSNEHNPVQTDTTFISNKGKVDTLIHYQLTDKDFKQ